MISSNASEKLELLSVEDARFPNQRHLLLLSSKQNQTVHNSEGDSQHWISGEYEIRATYLSGPLCRKTGSLVCEMGGKVDWNNSVRITNGEVMVKISELRGLKIGSYLFNRVVTWAKTLEPTRLVQQLRLSEVDAVSINNRARRNRLYRKFGLRLEFQADAPEAVGHSAADMSVAELVNFPDTEWPSLFVHRHLGALQRIFDEHQELTRKCRESDRRAAFYRRRLSRFDDVLRKIKVYVRAMFNIPLFVVGTFIGLGLGSFASSELGYSLSQWINRL